MLSIIQLLKLVMFILIHVHSTNPDPNIQFTMRTLGVDCAVTVNFRNGCGVLSGKTILLPYSLVITRLKVPSRESTVGGDMGAAEQIHG